MRSENQQINSNLIHFQELTKSLKFAFGLGVLRTIIPRFKMLFLKPLETLTKCATKFDYGLFIFLVSSNGLFKYLFCKMNQMNKLSLEKNCFLTGLAAGLSYWFYPKYIIFTFGLASTVEVKFQDLFKFVCNKLSIISDAM